MGLRGSKLEVEPAGEIHEFRRVDGRVPWESKKAVEKADSGDSAPRRGSNRRMIRLFRW